MPSPALSSILALAVLGAAPPPPLAGTITRLTIRQRIVIRVPLVEQPLPAAEPTITDFATPIRWDERKMPQCVPIRDIQGASSIEEDRVDLLVENIGRVRARLDDDCPGLDYYHGFYMRATVDGMICADRDVLRTRAGDQCAIDSFHRLVPKKRRHSRFP